MEAALHARPPVLVFLGLLAAWYFWAAPLSREDNEAPRLPGVLRLQGPGQVSLRDLAERNVGYGVKCEARRGYSLLVWISQISHLG